LAHEHAATVVIAPLGLLDFMPAHRLFVLVTVALVVAALR
jgi:hypothetical protein